MSIEGVIHFMGRLEVGGSVRGALIGTPREGSEVVVRAGAVVVGEIVAERVSVSGDVIGPVTASALLLVTETGRVDGEIRHREADFMMGSTVTGRLVPLDEENPVMRLASVIRDRPDQDSGTAQEARGSA